jgi:hypothetical protein
MAYNSINYRYQYLELILQLHIPAALFKVGWEFPRDPLEETAMRRTLLLPDIKFRSSRS